MDAWTYNYQVYQEPFEVIITMVPVVRALSVSVIRKLTRPFRLAWLLPGLLKLLRVLTSPEIRVIVKHDWRKVQVPFGSYLSPLLDRKNRIKAMTHHYNYLLCYLDKEFLTRIHQKPMALWKDNTNGVLYQIILSVSPSDYAQDLEGDLSLFFMADSTLIFTLSFTICPGSVFNVDAEHVMYIGRLQGGRDMMDLIRTSTKNCHDTSQQVLLLAVAQGICLSLSIRDMVCSSVSGQHSLSKKDERCVGDSIYDTFWIAMGAIKILDHAYHITIPMPKKPLTSIERSHRRRAAKRRRYRDAAADQAKATFCRLFMNERVLNCMQHTHIEFDKAHLMTSSHNREAGCAQSLGGPSTSEDSNLSC